MNEIEIDGLAAALLEHRAAGTAIAASDPGPVPADVPTGYAVQDAIEARLMREGVRPIGYKIGATNRAARKVLGTDAPFRGRLYDRSSHRSGTVLPADPNFQMIEVEIAIRLAEDLTLDMAPFHAAAIEAATASVMPAIEIVGTVYHPFNDAPIGALVADNAVHGAFIAGDEVTDWSQLDLMDGPVTLTIAGERRAEGRGRNVDDGPFAAAAFIANELAGAGGMLAAGSVITTGTVTPIVPVERGVDIEASFEGWGTVSVRIA